MSAVISNAMVTQYDFSATIQLKVVYSYLIALKFKQLPNLDTKESIR